MGLFGKITKRIFSQTEAVEAVETIVDGRIIRPGEPLLFQQPVYGHWTLSDDYLTFLRGLELLKRE